MGGCRSQNSSCSYLTCSISWCRCHLLQIVNSILKTALSHLDRSAMQECVLSETFYFGACLGCRVCPIGAMAKQKPCRNLRLNQAKVTYKCFLKCMLKGASSGTWTCSSLQRSYELAQKTYIIYIYVCFLVDHLRNRHSEMTGGITLQSSYSRMLAVMSKSTVGTGLVIAKLEKWEIRLLGTCMPPTIIVPTRMGFAYTFIVVFIVIQYWMFWVNTSMTSTNVPGDVDGAIVSKAAAFTHQMLGLVIEKRQKWKSELATALFGAQMQSSFRKVSMLHIQTQKECFEESHKCALGHCHSSKDENCIHIAVRPQTSKHVESQSVEHLANPHLMSLSAGVLVIIQDRMGGLIASLCCTK